MRKVVVYELVSLDGVADNPVSFFRDFDEVVQENLRGVIAGHDAVLLGRKTFDAWADDWSGSDFEPFAPFINKVRKYVVTAGPLAKRWENAEVAGAPLADFVAGLKRQDGGDIGVHGSLSLARTLLREDLVDELRLVVAPAIAATGRKLLDDVPPRRLQLTRGVTSPAGYLVLDYQVTR